MAKLDQHAGRDRRHWIQHAEQPTSREKRQKTKGINGDARPCRAAARIPSH